jgi:hypothetical protein
MSNSAKKAPPLIVSQEPAMTVPKGQKGKMVA